MSFVKLHSVILTSTVWMLSAEERIVWITLLVMADQDGLVSTSIPGLAHTARVDLGVAARAIEVFTSPDPYSRTEENEGRRLERVDGGFQLLNHAKYRELQGIEHRRALAAKRQEAWRKRHAADVTSRDSALRNALPTSRNVIVTTSEAEAEAEAEAKKTPEGEHAAPSAPLVAPAGAQPVRPAKAARGSRLPEGWAPSDATLAALRAEGHATPAGALASFGDYWRAVPGQRGVKLDWEGTYRNWVRRDATRGNGPGPRAPRRDGRILQELQPEQANADWMVRTPEGDERLRARREEIRASREESARKRQAEMDEMKARFGTR